MRVEWTRFGWLVLVACGASCSGWDHLGGVAPGASLGSCASCLDNKCGAQEMSCNTATCQAFATCARACTSGGCADGCLQQHSDSAAAGLDACFDANCSTCSASSTTSSCVVGPAEGACSACLKQSCCAQLNACVSDSTCVSIAHACSVCQSGGCLASCAQGSSNANATNLATCLAAACGGCG